MNSYRAWNRSATSSGSMRQKTKQDQLSSMNDSNKPSGKPNNAKTLVEYEFDKSVKVKEEIVQDQPNSMSDSNKPSGKPNSAKTLIEYEYDESVEVKEEVIENQTRHQSEEHKLLCQRNQLDGKNICSNNNYGARVLIEYDLDETLEIKEEIIQDREIVSRQKSRRKYDSTLNTLDKRETDILAVKKLRAHKGKKVQDSKPESQEKDKCQKSNSNTSQLMHNCHKCFLSYSSLRALRHHDRLKHAAVQPQFTCYVCGHKTTTKWSLSNHISLCHLKNAATSRAIHNCYKCFRSYSSLSALRQHDRLKHAAVKPEFICDVCTFKTNTKGSLSKHISSVHSKSPKTSQARHNCNKCLGSYISLSSLYQHDQLKHAGVKPQFICDFCGYETRKKFHLSRHISSRHFKNSTSQARHNCDKCYRSYSSLRGLNRHDRLKHAASEPKFVCNV